MFVGFVEGAQTKSSGVANLCVFPGQGDLVDACSAYISGYKILRMRWWLVGGNGHIGIGDKLVYARKLFKYSIKLARYLKQIKPDYGITNTIVLPHLACACKFLKIRHCWFIHEIPELLGKIMALYSSLSLFLSWSINCLLKFWLLLNMQMLLSEYNDRW